MAGINQYQYVCFYNIFIVQNLDGILCEQQQKYSFLSVKLDAMQLHWTDLFGTERSQIRLPSIQKKLKVLTTCVTTTVTRNWHIN